MARQYEWEDFTLIIGTTIIEGLRGMKYEAKRETEALYAKGAEPHSIQRGNLSYEGEMTMTQSQYETLRAAGNGTVLRLTVDAIASYGNPPDVVISDKLTGICFESEPKEFKQGDKFMEISLAFKCLKVEKVV